jgi:uncharacterized protein YjbI with pentapeptide repeats
MEHERIEQFELDAMLKKHHLFMIGKNGGARMVYKFKDLSNLNFHGMNISSADFTGSKMHNVLLANCNCNGTVFYGCDLTNSVLDNATFDRTDFRGALLVDISMRNVDLSKADTRKGQISQITKEKMVRVSDLVIKNDSNNEKRISDLVIKNDDVITPRESALDLTYSEAERRESFLDLSIKSELWDEMVKNHQLWLSSAGEKGEQMDISHQDMRQQKDLAQTSLTMIKGVDCKFDELYMVQVQMQGGNFSQSSVTKIAGREADFRGSNLNQVDFSDADLSYAHFESLIVKTPHGEQKLRTNLTGASFRNANLTKARFWDAILDNTDFRGAIMNDVDFRGADISKAIFDT